MRRQVLRVFRNVTTSAGHWIAFQFPSWTAAMAGAQIKIRASGFSAVQSLSATQGYRSQGPPVAFFGLGSITNVDEMVFQPVARQPVRIEHPAVDQFNPVK
jgi:hypothetical protein